MASWIKMRVDLADDPAVIAIAARLGVDEDTVVGKLHRVWSWFDQQTTTGNAAGVSAAWLDRRVACPGFAAAMIEVGWLIQTDSGLQLTNFDRHNGETGKQRALTAKRVAAHSSKANAKTNGTGVSKTNGASVITALPRIEKSKRREESSSESLNKQSSSSQAGGQESAETPAAGWEEVEEGLKRVGVKLARKAIASASGHGFTPPQVLALIAYIESKPTGATAVHGALFNRLVDQAADSVDWDADQNWPWSQGSGVGGQESAGSASPYAVPEHIQQANQKRLDQERLERDREYTRETERVSNLHSSTLEAMDDLAIQSLIGSDAVLRREYLAKGRDSPDVRHILLRRIDRSKPNPETKP